MEKKVPSDYCPLYSIRDIRPKGALQAEMKGCVTPRLLWTDHEQKLKAPFFFSSMVQDHSGTYITVLWQINA